MNTKQLIIAVVAGLTAAPALAQSPKMKMTTDIPKAYTAPDKQETSIGTLRYFDGVPSAESTRKIYDYLDTSRAVNVYLNSIPALTVNALREGQAAVGADTCNKICIWDSLMDSKSSVLTGNTSTMYAVGFLDLLKVGVFETLMYGARRELFVTTPDYVPDEAMQAALCACARRGVETTIIFPAQRLLDRGCRQSELLRGSACRRSACL